MPSKKRDKPAAIVTDQRKVLFVQHYMSADSLTYGNAYASAVKAGYSHQYARTILSAAPWVSELIRTGEVSRDEVIAGLRRETTATKSSDRTKAWELLGKTQRMFADRVEHGGKVELEHNLKGLSDDQLDAIIAANNTATEGTESSSDHGEKPAPSAD